MSVIDTLIIDRAGGDYAASDLTRVEAAVSYLNERLRERGYMARVRTRVEPWDVAEIPLSAEMARYLGNVHALAAAYTTFPGTPQLPANMDNIDHHGANAIERVLMDIDAIIALMDAESLYSDEIYSGEDNYV